MSRSLVVCLTLAVAAFTCFYHRQQSITAANVPKRAKWEYAVFGCSYYDPKHYPEINSGERWYWNGPDGGYMFRSPKELMRKMGIKPYTDNEIHNDLIYMMNALGDIGWEVVTVREDAKAEHIDIKSRVLVKRLK